MKRFIYIFILILITGFSASAQENKAVFYQELAWSPEGKYISFTGEQDIDSSTLPMKAGIYTVRIDGSELKKITPDSMNVFYSSWSKKNIIFGGPTNEKKETDLYAVNKDGSNLKQLTGNGGRNTTPSFSPDGKKIAFASNRDAEKYQIYVMNADGSNVIRLTKDSNVGYFNPVWSPDGKKIVYYSDKGDRKDQIWVMNADGSNQTLLTGNTGLNIFPSWSADGKKILFSANRDSESNEIYVNICNLYVMNADGSNILRLGNINSFFARFSPDGKKLAYISGKFPNVAIYISNADGSNAKKMQPN